MQAWSERERARASKTRGLNEAKARHWQGWDNSRGSAGSSQDLGPDFSSNPMVGTWLYGKKPNEYHLLERSDGTLCFDGPSPVGTGRLRGGLKLDGDWHVAEIAHGNGELFGSMRFLFISGEDGEEGLISQCRKAGSSEWGREVFACRATRRSSSQCEPSTPSTIATSGGQAGASTDQDTALEPDLAAAGGSELRVTITVDRALGFSTEVLIPWGTTVLKLKERLAADDPTGSTTASGFGLALSTADASQEASMLPDDTVLSEQHASLDICQLREQGQEVSAASDGGAMADPQPERAEGAVDPPPNEEALPAESALLAWLKGIRLEAYHDAVVEQGFEQLEDLRGVPASRLEELTSLAGMKLGHAVRFRKAVKDLGGAAS